MTVNRRQFLKGAGAAVTAFLLPPGLARVARADGSDPVLVVIYLRGAADGLNVVVPHGDADYYTLRPNIQVAPGNEIDLDGFFGLNPAFGALHTPYLDGDLCLIHAAGSPNGTRSHFDAQDFMERAAPDDPLVGDGWLNRCLASLGASDSWAGISLGPAKALALVGAAPSLAFSSIEDFALLGPEGRRAALEAMYQSASPVELEDASQQAFSAIDVIATVETGTEVVYPPGPYGAALADAAALIKANIGVRVVAIDIGGWDHHEGENNQMPGVGGSLAAGLAAFRSDLGGDLSRTCTLTMTEFGRTAAENGTGGTDHGHGSFMAAMGGGVVGGRVLLRDASWPGLGPGDLFEGRDLEVTTDFRDVFAEVLNQHMGLSLGSLAPVLPNHVVDAGNFPGLFSA